MPRQRGLRGKCRDLVLVCISAWALMAQSPSAVLGGNNDQAVPNQTDSSAADPKLDELRLLTETLSVAESAGEISAALESAKSIATLYKTWNGAKPWEILDSDRKIEILSRIESWSKPEQAAWHAIRTKQEVAGELNTQGKYEEAQPLFFSVLAYYQDLQRDPKKEDPATLAQCFSNCGLNLYLQAQFGKAQSFFDSALTWRVKVLGEEHPDTAASIRNCGENLRAQGQYQRAQEQFEKAVSILAKIRGDAHPETATAWNSLALCLAGQGKFAAARPLYENALVTLRQSRGLNHRDTATAYSNLATNLSAQGRYADALPLFEQAMAIFLRQKDPENRDTATAYNNLATILRAQFRHAEAQPYFEKALTLRISVLGANHADTGQSHYNLAVNYGDQERYDEAQPHFERALAIFREQLTDQHADTAIGYLKLAANLQHQGRFLEARKYLEQSLAIRRDVFGEFHPDTAQGYHELALNSNYLGDFASASELWIKAADSFERVRLLIALSGLDRAVKTGEQSPTLFLAALHARRGELKAAWARWESGLARGLLDDIAARPAGKLSAADRQREREIQAEIRRLDVVRAVLNVKSSNKVERDKQLETLHIEQLALQAKLSDLQADLAKNYGIAQGQSYDLARIQKCLAADGALISWLDIPGNPKAQDPQGEHWGVVIRQQGPPRWVKLSGTGEDNRWTPDDDQLGQQLAGVLANPANRPLRHTAGQIRQLVIELKVQRMDPLEPHLGAIGELPAVSQLIVLPASAMRAVPLELVVGDKITVSYAPSGTLYAWLVEQKRLQPAPATAPQAGLLAVGDPIFERHPIPVGGVYLNAVSNGGLAQSSGLQSGDVLLSYAEKRLNGADDLRSALASVKGPETSVPILFWRRGETVRKVIPSGKLGVSFLPESATEILRNRRSGEQAASGTREAFQQLPGTRTEVEAISRTFAAAKLSTELLLGENASEARLEDMSSTDQLRKFRFLHFATHGVPDAERPMRSRIILSRNNLPDPRQQLLAGKPIFRGELTAEHVLNHWKLNADLVSLSACQSGLGQYAAGEGHLGFAQALLLSGARSLLLSLWKVDDSATSLLMARFYENILGTRSGLTGPMTTAAALHEAKMWLRHLTTEQVARITSQQGAEGAAPPPTPAGDDATAHASEHPFEHPAFWAAFILIGAPE